MPWAHTLPEVSKGRGSYRPLESRSGGKKRNTSYLTCPHSRCSSPVGWAPQGMLLVPALFTPHPCPDILLGAWLHLPYKICLEVPVCLYPDMLLGVELYVSGSCSRAVQGYYSRSKVSWAGRVTPVPPLRWHMELVPCLLLSSYGKQAKMTEFCYLVPTCIKTQERY